MLILSKVLPCVTLLWQFDNYKQIELSTQARWIHTLYLDILTKSKGKKEEQTGSMRDLATVKVLIVVLTQKIKHPICFKFPLTKIFS